MRISEMRVFLLLYCSVQCLCLCPLPPSRSTYCNVTAPPDNFPIIQGSPPSSGSCEFQSSFCSYTQGCRDTEASNWTLLGPYAEVPGKNDRADHYSFLLSPLLRINYTTCLKFNASTLSPSALSVHFGEELNNSCTVMPEDTNGVESIFARNMNIRPATGKIFFRAKGGGSAAGHVRLYNVSLITGNCYDPLCGFDGLYNDKACDFWEWNDWTVTRANQSTGNEGNVAALKPGLRDGTLKTDLLMATGTKTTCVQFFYRMTGINDTLAVSVQIMDGTMALLWEVTNTNTSSSWHTASIPHVSHGAFFIIFQGQRCRAIESEDIAIDSIRVSRRSSPCPYLPEGSNSSSQQRTSTLDPSCDPSPGSGSTEALEGSGQNDPIPAIVGAIAGVVVLAVVAVVLVVVIRRVRNKKRGESKNDKMSPSDGFGGRELSKTKDVSIVLSSGGDYAYVTSTLAHAAAPITTAGIAPYEVVEGVTPGKPRFSSNDEYNVLNVHGSGQKIPKPHGYSEEHYSHINNSQPSALHSQEQKTRKRDATEQRPFRHQGSSALGLDPGVVYGQVQKKGKREATKQPSAAGGLTYSAVQKKGNKPTAIAKPVVSDDYNRIDLSGQRSDANAVGSDGVQNTYNKLDKI